MPTQGCVKNSVILSKGERQMCLPTSFSAEPESKDLVVLRKISTVIERFLREWKLCPFGADEKRSPTPKRQ